MPQTGRRQPLPAPRGLHPLRGDGNLGNPRRGRLSRPVQQGLVRPQHLCEPAFLPELRVRDALVERVQTGDSETVLLEQAIDLLDAPHAQVPADREILEPAGHGQQAGLGQTCIGHARRKPDVEAEIHIPGDQHLARVDHQYVGTYRGLRRTDVVRTGHVADDGARLALGYVDDSLAEGAGGGHDEIAVREMIGSPRADDHPRAHILYDPSHFVLQQLDYLDFIDIYHERIKMFHVKDAEFNPTGRSGVYGGYQGWVDRPGRFRSLGDGQADFRGIFSKLTQYGFDGWAVLEWECCLKHPEQGAREGATFIEDHIIEVAERAFDDFAGGEADDDANRRILGLD